jgi:hypothetical protein
MKGARSHPKARYEPHACDLSAGCMRGACEMRSYSLRILFVFSSYSLRVLPSFLRRSPQGAVVILPRRQLRWRAAVCLLFNSNCAKTWRWLLCAPERFRGGPSPEPNRPVRASRWYRSVAGWRDGLAAGGATQRRDPAGALLRNRPGSRFCALPAAPVRCRR